MPNTPRKSIRKGGRAARLNKVNRTSLQPNALINKGTANYTIKPSSKHVCIIACGAIAHEILDIIQMNDLEHISLTCLPAKYHNTPDKIVPAIEQAIIDARAAGFGKVFCGYADCGTGGALDRLLQRENVARLPGAHCYSFFSGVERFENDDNNADLRSFFLTDFLARHFDGLTWKPLGLEENPELLEMYFGAYEKVVFLSQQDDPDLLERAKEIALKLELSFEHRKTGYGDLATSLSDASLLGLEKRSKSDI